MATVNNVFLLNTPKAAGDVDAEIWAHFWTIKRAFKRAGWKYLASGDAVVKDESSDPGIDLWGEAELVDAERVWQVDVSGGPSFVDITSPFNSAAVADTQPFPVTDAVGDYMAIAGPGRFGRLTIDYTGGTAGIGGVVIWEYSTGPGTWAALSNVVDPSAGFTTAAGSFVISFDVPSDWVLVTENGDEGYYIRARITMVYSTNPVIDSGSIRRATAGKASTPNSGAAATIAAPSRGRAVVTGLTNMDSPGSKGNFLQFTGATNGANNNLFQIEEILSETSVAIDARNVPPVAEATLNWEEIDVTNEVITGLGPAGITAARAWSLWQGPSIVKVPITSEPVVGAGGFTFIRGENVVQATTGAEGEIIGFVFDSVSVTGYLTISPRVVGLTTAATGTLTSSGQVSDGDTVTIDGKVYTYQTTLTNVDGNVQIGASQALSMENLRKAINLDPTAGTDYAAAMTLHPTVSAVDTATMVVVTAKTAGTAGNSITTTETGALLAWGGATLAGGVGGDTVYTWGTGNTITGDLSGATVDQVGTALEYRQQCMISKDSFGGGDERGSIYFQCIEPVGETADSFLTLAAAAGCTSSTAPGQGGTGNAFPTIGYVNLGDTTVNGAAWTGFNSIQAGGNAQCIAVDAIWETDYSADGSWFVYTGHGTLSGGPYYGRGFHRLDDTEPGDLDPFCSFGISLTNMTIPATARTTAPQSSSGSADHFNTANQDAFGTGITFWRAWRRRGLGTEDLFITMEVAPQRLLQSSSLIVTQAVTGDAEKIATEPVATKAREPVRVLCALSGLKMRKGTVRHLSIVQGGNPNVTYDGGKFMQLSAINGAFVADPWDELTVPQSV